MIRHLQMLSSTLLIGFLLSFFSPANAQNKPTSTSLREALQQLSKRYNTKLVYDPGIIEGKQTMVDVKASTLTVEELLKTILYPHKLLFLYVGSNNYAIVKSADPHINESSQPVTPPKVNINFTYGKISITGIVTDSNNNPLVGASVIPEGSKSGVLTSSDGRFTLNIDSKYQALNFGYVGMAPTRVLITGSVINVVLLPLKSVNVLQEVQVVSDGYTTISKERAAGSYSIVTQKDIQSTPTINLMERLEGKIPGVKFDVLNNTIQIRGVNNYSGNSGNPLIVIDGFPLISPNDQQSLTTLPSSTASGNSILTNFNPADIEQITILKDASATSIWGSRGANGVIVIETKKGKRMAPSVNLSYTLGISKNPSLNSLQWMSSAQYVSLEQEMVNKGFLTDPALATPANALYTPNNSEATEWMYRVTRGTATAAQRDAALAEIGSRSNYGQIQKYLLQNAVNQQYNISVSGGSDNTTYYIAGNYNSDQPIYKSNNAHNSFLTANTTTDLFKKRITFRTNINYQLAQSTYNGAAIDALSTSTTALRPYDMLVDANGNTIKRTVLFRESVAAGYVAQGYLPFSYNAVDELNYSNTIAKTNTFRVGAGLNGKIFSWLNADFSAMTQRIDANTSNINETNSYLSRIQINTGTVVSAGKLVYNVPYGGTYTLGNQSAYDNSYRGQLNANYIWKTDHYFTMIAGTEIRETYNKLYAATRYGYDGDTNTSQAVNPTTPYLTFYGYSTTLGNNLSSITESKKRYLSYFSNASYAYQGKYIATGSLRFDDNTLVGVDRSKRAIPLWSSGLRWNISKENFLKNSNWVDDLALRVTLGTGGSVPSGGSNIPIISVSGTDARTGQPIASISSPGNSDLGWETTKTWNYGTDFSIFHNRFSGSVDIYTKQSNGILTFVPYDATYGWSTLQFNTATLSGHGYEFGLTGAVVRSEKFGWSSTFNFSYNTNKVTDTRFTNNTSSVVTSGSPIEGVPIGALFVYKWAGLDNKGQSQIYDRNNNIIGNTTNLTSAFTRDDLKYAGVTNPPYFGGFFNTFRYKEFELSTQITYYLGSVFLKQSINNYPTYQGTYSGVLGRQADLAARWENPGDETTTNVPGLTGINNNSIVRYRYSDLLVRNGNNIRFQQLSLAYNVPTKYLPRNSFKKLSVSANARNLGIIWRANKDGIDPLYLNSTNYSNLPPTTSFVFSLNASL